MGGGGGGVEEVNQVVYLPIPHSLIPPFTHPHLLLSHLKCANRSLQILGDCNGLSDGLRNLVGGN